MTNSGQSMPPISETWSVRVGRETFRLDGKEMAVVLEAIRSGVRGIVQLKDRGFSIAHIESYWLERREKNQLRLDRPEAAINNDEKNLAEKKLAEIKKKYNFLRKTAS